MDNVNASFKKMSIVNSFLLRTSSEGALLSIAVMINKFGYDYW